MQGLSQPALPEAISRGDAAAALGWLVMAGADTGVEAIPRNWLIPAPRPAEGVRAMVMAAPAARPSIATTPPAPGFDAATLDTLVERVGGFAHPLRRADLTPQLLSGNIDTGTLIVCEQPEAEGSPAAMLRGRMLAAIGLDAGNSALLHRLPWPTTGARIPRTDEVAAFAPFVTRALELVRPRLILAFGQCAAALAGEPMALSSARGRWADVIVDGRAVPLLATCNPRYLLTQPLRKRDAWADLQAFAARIAEPA